MKLVALVSGLSLSIVALASERPASAQFVSIPVSNGSFAVSSGAAGNQYSSPLTLLSPAGTINITGTPAQPIYQSAFTITTNTPIGVYITGISGSADLNDGRTATFNQSAAAKLETRATVTGAANYVAGSAIPNGVTVSFTVSSGSFDIPQASLSAYPTPQVEIPITGGSFTIAAPAGAGFETMTIDSALTPLGTTTLTLTNPLLVDPANTAFPYFIGGEARLVRISGLLNGTIALDDGRTFTLSDRFAVLEGTAQVTSPAPNNVYQFPAIYTTPITLTGTFTGGVVNVPEPEVVLPTPPSDPVIPTPEQPTDPVVLPPTDPVVLPPTDPVVLPPFTPQFAVGFDETLNLGGDPNEFIDQEEARSLPRTIPVVERSSLEFSRIHPGLRASQ